MSNLHYQFGDDHLQTAPNRKHRKKRSQQNTWHTNNQHLAPRASFDEDGHDGSVSLTYSASSSQAGESTDSSIADSSMFLEMEQQEHQLQKEQRNAQQIRCSPRDAAKEGSSVADSMTYSEDEEGRYYAQNDFPGQSSNSFGHDGGGFSDDKKIFFAAATGDYASHRRGRKSSSSSSHKQESLFSPKNVAASDSSFGNNSNPSSPPPRHKRVISDQGSTEVWYAKWWMCGFTDALNLNSK